MEDRAHPPGGRRTAAARCTGTEAGAGGAVLHWRGAGADRAYVIEAVDARGGERIRSWTTPLRGFSRIEDLGSGRQVRVRIRALRADGVASAWSEWMETRTL